MQYRGWNPDKAVEDYFVRINDHEKHYQPVEETTWPFIRIINVSLFACFHRLMLTERTGRRKGHG